MGLSYLQAHLLYALSQSEAPLSSKELDRHLQRQHVDLILLGDRARHCALKLAKRGLLHREVKGGTAWHSITPAGYEALQAELGASP